MNEPVQDIHWKQLSRTTLVDTKFLKVYNDHIQLPSGQEFDDYSVVSLPNGVVIVATDIEGRLITQYEYKYAIDQTILNLPSGGTEEGDSPEDTARKELLEETGYTADSFEVVQPLYEYPSKLTHVLYIVRAKNAYKVKDVAHEATEAISPVKLIEADEDYEGTFNTTYNVAALAITVPEFLKIK